MNTMLFKILLGLVLIPGMAVVSVSLVGAMIGPLVDRGSPRAERLATLLLVVVPVLVTGWGAYVWFTSPMT